MPAWWAHIRNQRILNDYITSIVRARWEVIQKERALALTLAESDGPPDANGPPADPAGGRKRDILDKVLDSLEPGEWGKAAVLQVGAPQL